MLFEKLTAAESIGISRSTGSILLRELCVVTALIRTGSITEVGKSGQAEEEECRGGQRRSDRSDALRPLRGVELAVEPHAGPLTAIHRVGTLLCRCSFYNPDTSITAGGLLVMCANLRLDMNGFGRLGFVALLLAVSSTSGQTPQKPVIAHGEITGADVYVRSGASLNHYPVCKLNAGDRVTVVGETGDWYEILPPDSVVSYISGDYVDSTDGRTGVVNGDNVRVRAGSTLPDFHELKYVVQTKLSKGAEITILGREADGFLRIKPPSGTTVWVSRSFLEFVPVGASVSSGNAATTPVSAGTPTGSGDAAQGSGAKVATVTGSGAADGAIEGVVGAGATPAVGDASASPLAAVHGTPLRGRLEELDSAAREMLAKPVADRDFESLIERYRQISSQEDDEFGRRYALARIDQLTRMAALVETVRKMRELSDETGSKRREFLEGRAKIREMLPPIPSGVDAQGELRVSALYPPGRLPSRYRLVDRSGEQERTIGYVEIPEGSSITVDDFLGRHVGVMASAKRLQKGGVNPVPIYVTRDLVLLQPTMAPKESSSPD